MEPEMINYIWGAVGVGLGVCFATFVLTISNIFDDHHNQRNCVKCRKSYENKIRALKNRF